MILGTAFFRQWGAPLLAGGLAIGMGLGFWLYVDAITDAKVRAEKERDQALGRIEIMQTEAVEDAKDLEFLRTRRAVEQALSEERLNNETDRRVAAERRNSNVTGALNALRTEIDDRQCGVGADLTQRLRDNRTDREPGDESSTRSTASTGSGDMQTGG